MRLLWRVPALGQRIFQARDRRMVTSFLLLFARLLGLVDYAACLGVTPAAAAVRSLVRFPAELQATSPLQISLQPADHRVTVCQALWFLSRRGVGGLQQLEQLVGQRL